MAISLTLAACLQGCMGFPVHTLSSGETKVRLRKPASRRPADMPASVRAVAEGGHVESLANSPSVAVGGTQYFAARVRSPGGLRGSSLIVLYPETAWRQARREAAMPALLLGIASLAAMVMVTSGSPIA